MKKILAAMLVVLSAFLLVSCGGDEDVECRDVGELMCPGSELTLCANEKKGTAWFEYEGEKYKCEGKGEDIDCDKAVEEVYKACGRTNCEYGTGSACDYQVCTDENGSRWYEYNGKKYECEGTWEDIDCDRANEELNNDCEGY